MNQNFTLEGAVAALEELEMGIADALSTPTVQEEEASDAIAQELDVESAAQDSDAQAMSDRTQKIGEVIDMVEGSETPSDQPLPDAVQRGASIALESLGFGLEADDPAKDSKESFVKKLWRFFAALWEGMRRFAANMIATVKKAYTYATDRSARNRSRAEKAKEAMGDKTFNRKMADFNGRKSEAQGGEIFPERLIKAMARPSGVTIAKAGDNVIDYIRGVNRVLNRGTLLDAATILGECAEKPGEIDIKAKEFLQLLSRIGDATGSNASAEQAKAIGDSSTDTVVVVTAPFFGGHRGWLAIPSKPDTINKFNHGLSVVDKPDSGDRMQDVPSVDTLKSTADLVIKLDDAIGEYRTQMSALDGVESALKKMADRVKGKLNERDEGGNSTISASQVRALAEAMNAALPKLIKGPQVAAVRYAAEVGNMLMSYVDAGMGAYTDKIPTQIGSVSRLTTSKA